MVAISNIGMPPMTRVREPKRPINRGPRCVNIARSTIETHAVSVIIPGVASIGTKKAIFPAAASAMAASTSGYAMK